MTDNNSDLEVNFDEDDNRNEGSWMTTYADMVTLLLTFFVLLFSMSTIDQTQFTDSFTAIKEALAGKKSKLATSRISAKDASVLVEQVRTQRQILEQQKRVFSSVKYLQTTKGMKGVLTAKLDKGKIVLRLPSGVLFKPGSADLTPRGRQAIALLKNFFAKYADQTINIKGYTDDLRPGKGSRYRDNWELSSMRAVNVLRYLVKLGLSPNRMTATGLADMQPLYPNTSPENRAKNRRVVFVLEKQVG